MTVIQDGRGALTDAVRSLLTSLQPFAARRVVEAQVHHGSRPIERHHARQILDHLAPELEAVVGRAWFPVVGAAGGGLVRVDVYPQHVVPIGVGQPMAHAFAAALQAGARLAGDERPLVAVLWPDATEAMLDGTSFELAVALAAWSRIAGRALPAGLALTGELGPEGSVRAPNHLRQKREVVTEAWGTGGRLLSGPTGATGVEGASELTGIVHDLLNISPAPLPFGSRLDQVRRHWAARAWDRVAECAAGILADPDLEWLPADEAFDVAVQRAQALAHLGRHGEARGTLVEALGRFTGRVPGQQRAWAAAVLGIALLDAGERDEARAVLEAALADLRGQDDATRYGRAQLFGTLARVESASGRHEDAVRCGQHAFELTRPYERARNLGDLAFWYLRAGDVARARTWLDQADAALPAFEAVRPLEAAATRAFLQMFRARLCLAEGDADATTALANPLIENENLAVMVGALEVCTRLGLPMTQARARLDAHPALAPGQPPSVLSRYRARIELARPEPDLARVAGWVGEPVSDAVALAERLAREVPY